MRQNWDEEQSLLSERLSRAKTIPGTQRLHCFVPLTTRTIQVREYSASIVLPQWNCRYTVFMQLCEHSRSKRLHGSEIWQCLVGWLHHQNRQWITGGNVTFLHPHGPSKSFSYPDPADVLILHISDLLISVDPKTYTGRSYHLTDKEMNTATKALYSHLHK